MSIRISTTLSLSASLLDSQSKLFCGDGVLSELLDTLAHGGSSAYQIAPAESVPLDFGDVEECRFLFLQGDGEFSVSFGAGLPTAAVIDGAGGTYPTAFSGGENLDLEIDGIAISVVFDAADQTRDQVVARINFAAALADASFVSDPVAFPLAAQLRLQSLATGGAANVQVLATSAPAALTALGLTASEASGDAAEPGTTDVQVARPVDPSGASAAYGVKAYFLGTIQATSVTVTNTQADADLNLIAFVAGDLVSTP